MLPSIISQDQQGFIKNRCIGSSIRLIQDIIDYTELLNCDGAILLIDLKKAFDTIDWRFLFKSLKKFKFKECFIKTQILRPLYLITVGYQNHSILRGV